MLSVLRQYELPLHFPKPVLAEARAIGWTVSEHEVAGREDCRAHQVITIDPDDAKDFDDALAIANNTEYGLTGAIYTSSPEKKGPTDRLEYI